MTLSELRSTLLALTAEQRIGISREEFAHLFPPGEPDDRARASCHEFASSVGCRVEVMSERHSIWFVKVN